MLPSLILELAVEPIHRGFYCNDQMLAYPYKSDTISVAVTTVIMMGVPLIVVSCIIYPT